jgi:Uncharacterised nucleotidyltransferase
VLQALRRRAGAAVPPAAYAVMEQDAARTAAHSPGAYDQLAAALAAFRSAGIRAAVIKGAGMAWFVYTDAALRPFSDFDLLISPRDREAAGRALASAGYVSLPAAPSVLDAAGEQTYWDPAWRRPPIDLHWRFDAAPVCLGLDYEAIRRRAVSRTVAAVPVLALSAADTVVALSASFVKHLWGGQPRLRYLRDIVELAVRCPVDWDGVVATAVDSPFSRSALRNALSAAVYMLDASVPADVISRLAPVRGFYLDRCLTALTCRRILRRQTWPFPAVMQIAAMRWLDKDRADIYLKLGRAAASMRWQRVTTARAQGAPPKPPRRMSAKTLR